MTGTGRACGSHRAIVSTEVKASRPVLPSAAAHQHGRHVAGLVVGEALLVDLDLAEDGDHRHEQPGVLQHREHRRRTTRRAGAVLGEHAGERGVARAGVVGEARVGDGPHQRLRSVVGVVHGAIVPEAWTVVGLWAVEGTTWAALTAALTVAGAIWTWIAFRRRGAANGLRALGFTLLPAAAWLTGTLEMVVEIAGSVTDWATGLVFNILTWAGVGLAGLAVRAVRRQRLHPRPPAGARPGAGASRPRRRRADEPARRAAARIGAREGRLADRRRDGRHRGAAEEARHRVSDHFVDRNRLWSRLDAAVAALPEPPPTPIAVVDLDAFDANAADLVRRAGGKPIRVASKSLRVPALIQRALAARRLRRRAGLHAAPRRSGSTRRASATTSSWPTRRSTPRRCAGWPPPPRPPPRSR